MQDIEVELPQSEKQENTMARENTPPRCSCFTIVFFSVLAIGAVSGLSLVFTGSSNPLDYFVPVDPPGEKDAFRWDFTAGLELMVENACDDTWTATFDKSIADWNVSESLILRTRQIPYDFDCDLSFGRLKVCNGDYGETNWRGINVVAKKNDLIIYSTSKLNDFWTKSADQKLYTMCHENGHGFGLPHTDEDHFNRDRGDCLDYTNRPRNNLNPGQFNFDLLNTLYGTPDSPVVLIEAFDEQDTSPAPAPVPAPVNGGNAQIPDEKEDKKNKNKDDRRRLRGLGDIPNSIVNPMPASCLERAKLAEDLCESDHCVYDLGYGYDVHINKLLV